MRAPQRGYRGPGSAIISQQDIVPGAPFWVSWSGGKDCCLALHRAQQSGGVCSGLACAFDESGQRSRSHGLRPQVLEAQARAMNLPLQRAFASWQTYEREFIAMLSQMRESGTHDIVFGDIDLQDHRDWEEKVCGLSQVRAHLPLWQGERTNTRAARRELLEEFLGAGFVALIVAVREDKLPREMLGRTLDWDTVAQIEALGADACGEEGEFHTLVVDGPLFRERLQVLAGPETHVEYNVCSVDVRLAAE
jgi:uncharacterized protein (TIGR00290 family)